MNIKYITKNSMLNKNRICLLVVVLIIGTYLIGYSIHHLLEQKEKNDFIEFVKSNPAAQQELEYIVSLTDEEISDRSFSIQAFEEALASGNINGEYTNSYFNQIAAQQRSMADEILKEIEE